MTAIMRCDAPISIAYCFVLILTMILPEKAAAQRAELSNADLCNGETRSSEISDNRMYGAYKIGREYV